MNKPKADKAAKLHNLRLRFLKSLPERFTDIVDRWGLLQQQLAQSQPTQQLPCPSQIDDLIRQVHSLAGTAATFGCPRLGKRAQELELMLGRFANDSDTPSSSEIENAISQLVKTAPESPLVSEPQNTGTNTTPMADESDHHLIYILDNSKLAPEVVKQLHQLEYEVKIFHNSAELSSAVNARRPEVLIADIQLAEEDSTGYNTVATISANATPHLPVIFMAADDAWQNRLSAVRAGGQGFLSKPINIDELIERLDSFRGKTAKIPYHILIVEDTELLAEHYADTLQAASMETMILNEPSGLLDALPEFAPDLVLMDLNMPGCNGVEAARVIRQHLTYTNLPIVYLSTETGLNEQLAALQVGGDDFLQKPISDDHLVAAVKIRAQRFRQLNALADKDRLTGLLNHVNLKLALEREIIRAQRQDSQLSFAMLDIDHFKSVNDQYGHPAGDRVIQALARLLSKRLRKTDIAARYGGEEFAIILPDTPPIEATGLLNELRESFAGLNFSYAKGHFTATFSAGTVAYSTDKDMKTLIATADDSLYQAKRAGRNCVILAN